MFGPTLRMVEDVDQCTSLVSPQLLCARKNITKKSGQSLRIGNKILICSSLVNFLVTTTLSHLPC